MFEFLIIIFFSTIVRKDSSESDSEYSDNEESTFVGRKLTRRSTAPNLGKSWKDLRHCATVPDLAAITKEWETIKHDVLDDVKAPTTGLLEDIKLFQLTVIDFVMSRLMWLWHSIILVADGFSVFSLLSIKFILWPIFFFMYLFQCVVSVFTYMKHSIIPAFNALIHPSTVLERNGFDTRTKEEIVNDSGYPYELITVTTTDGYIITLERLPHPESTKVLYFQHGLIDSGFTWLASGNSTSLAMAAYDKGYDVFLGNFRGNPPTSHEDENISSSDYWDFTINDHGKLIYKYLKYLKLILY